MPFEDYEITDTLNNLVSKGQLQNQIQANSTITKNLLDIVVQFASPSLRIEFDVALSVPEQTALDGIVAAHNGEGTINANSDWLDEGRWTFNGNGGATARGLFESITQIANQGSGSQGIAGTGQYQEFLTQAVLGEEAGIYNDNLFFRGDNWPEFGFKFHIDHNTDVRVFVGICDSGALSAMSADDPAVGYYGLQFSTNRSDTNWQFAMKDTGAGTQTLIDTGVVPVVGQAYRLRGGYQGGILEVFLENLDTLEVLWSSKISSNIIPASTNVGARMMIEALAAAGKEITAFSGCGVRMRK